MTSTRDRNLSRRKTIICPALTNRCHQLHFISDSVLDILQPNRQIFLVKRERTSKAAHHPPFTTYYPDPRFARTSILTLFILSEETAEKGDKGREKAGWKSAGSRGKKKNAASEGTTLICYGCRGSEQTTRALPRTKGSFSFSPILRLLLLSFREAFHADLWCFRREKHLSVHASFLVDWQSR